MSALYESAPVAGPPVTLAPEENILDALDFDLDSIDLYITSRCNRACGHCFLPDSYFASKIHMSVETVGAILDWCGSAIREVTILGGEPSLHPGFSEVVRTAARRGRDVRVVTNGSSYFRRKVLADGLSGLLTRVAVSLDAPSAVTADRLRGPRSFTDASETMRLLSRLGIPYDINFTVTTAALEEVDDMLTFADSSDCARLNVHWMSQVGRGRSSGSALAPSPDQWRSVLHAVSNFRPARSNLQIDCQLAYSFDLPGEDQDSCAARERTNLQFMPDGSVFSCGLLVENPRVSGYLWTSGAVTRRPGNTELTCATDPGHGCPARRLLPDYQEEGGPLPLCIYNRLKT